MVDVANQDYQAFAEFNINTGKNYADFEPISKIRRFKMAFNGFFPQLRYKKVSETTEEKVVLFEKHGKEIMIDQLSTGEKQVVFRGVSLLKNSGNMEDGTAFIDEPELSMHPSWQR